MSQLFAVIDGKFSGWGAWSDCPTEGGGQQFRTRQCDNPPPANGGSDCLETNVDARPCPSWSAWGSWSWCRNNGTKTRTRTCTNPAPVAGQTGCVGHRVETKNCDSVGGYIHFPDLDWTVSKAKFTILSLYYKLFLDWPPLCPPQRDAKPPPPPEAKTICLLCSVERLNNHYLSNLINSSATRKMQTSKVAVVRAKAKVQKILSRKSF